MSVPEFDHAVLESGDRLTRDAFERRYGRSSVRKAELIRGVVYVASPVRSSLHGQPHGLLAHWLVGYSLETPGTAWGCDATVRLTDDSEPQPDLHLRLVGSEANARVDAEDYIVGAPELIVEIAASSASYDLHDKKSAYAEAGVREYLVWRTADRAADCFALRGGSFDDAVDTDGLWRSRVFAGLWLDPAALVTGDVDRLRRVAAAGLASPEHVAFAGRAVGGDSADPR